MLKPLKFSSGIILEGLFKYCSASDLQVVYRSSFKKIPASSSSTPTAEQGPIAIESIMPLQNFNEFRFTSSNIRVPEGDDMSSPEEDEVKRSPTASSSKPKVISGRYVSRSSVDSIGLVELSNEANRGLRLDNDDDDEDLDDVPIVELQSTVEEDSPPPEPVIDPQAEVIASETKTILASIFDGSIELPGKSFIILLKQYE